MKRFVLAVLALSFGCSTDPDEVLVVRGTLLSDDVVEGQQVRLLRRVHRKADPFSYEMCDPSLAIPFQETEVDSSGTYRFEPLRAEAAGFTVGTSICFRAETTFPSGSSAWSDFFFQKEGERRLTALRDWRSGLALDGGVLTFEPVVPWPNLNAPARELDGGPHFEAQLIHRATIATADGGVIWRTDDMFQNFNVPRVPFEVDALRLEDFSGSLSLQVQLIDPTDPSHVWTDRLTPPPAYMLAAERLSLAGSLVPLSRGLPCPEFGDPCPFTDGELVDVDVGAVDRFTFELRSPSEVTALVLRGLVLRGPAVEIQLAHEDGGLTSRNTTIDRTKWFEPAGELFLGPDGNYARAMRGFAVLHFDAGVPTQRVTIRFSDGLLRASEFSIFGQ